MSYLYVSVKESGTIKETRMFKGRNKESINTWVRPLGFLVLFILNVILDKSISVKY